MRLREPMPFHCESRRWRILRLEGAPSNPLRDFEFSTMLEWRDDGRCRLICYFSMQCSFERVYALRFEAMHTRSY